MTPTGSPRPIDGQDSEAFAGAEQDDQVREAGSGFTGDQTAAGGADAAPGKTTDPRPATTYISEDRMRGRAQGPSDPDDALQNPGAGDRPGKEEG